MSRFIDPTQLLTGTELVLKNVPIRDPIQEQSVREQFNTDIQALKDIAFPEPVIRVTQKISPLGDLQPYLELVIQTDVLFDYAGCNKILKQNNGNSPDKNSEQIRLPIKLDYQLFRVWDEAELHEYDADLKQHVFYDNKSNLQTLHDRRSRLIHSYIADMIRTKPDLFHIAKARIEKLIAKNSPQNPQDAVYEWHNILDHWSLDDVLNFIVSDTEKADQLRQSTPFVGYIDNEERWKLHKAFWANVQKNTAE
jgi:hypothetical protein